MSTNIKPPEDATVITPDHAAKALRSVAKGLALTGWGPWHHVPSLLGRTVAALHHVDADEHTVKMAGRMLGDRVMQLSPAHVAEDQARPWGVTCTRGRWRWISQDDMAPIAVADAITPVKALAFRVLREIGIDSPHLIQDPCAVAAIIVRLRTKADIAQRLADEIERQHGMSHDINIALLAECRAAGLDVRGDS